jgi:hypothetical protein
VSASTPAATKSPLEMVQSVVSSIQVPAAPLPAPPPPRLTATPLTLPTAPDLKTTQLPTGHFLVSSNGHQLIFQVMRWTFNTRDNLFLLHYYLLKFQLT